MADKIHHPGEASFYATGMGKFDLGTMNHHNSNWTDGFPHEFKGWGPQTPDPDETPGPAPATDLVWKGGGDHHDHQVWSFERRRHH